MDEEGGPPPGCLDQGNPQAGPGHLQGNPGEARSASHIRKREPVPLRQEGQETEGAEDPVSDNPLGVLEPGEVHPPGPAGDLSGIGEKQLGGGRPQGQGNLPEALSKQGCQGGTAYRRSHSSRPFSNRNPPGPRGDGPAGHRPRYASAGAGFLGNRFM